MKVRKQQTEGWRGEEKRKRKRVKEWETGRCRSPIRAIEGKEGKTGIGTNCRQT